MGMRRSLLGVLAALLFLSTGGCGAAIGLGIQLVTPIIGATQHQTIPEEPPVPVYPTP